MRVSQKDIEEYIQIKEEYGMEYDIEEVKSVFYCGNFENYSTYTLDYMMRFLYNGAKVGRKSSYRWDGEPKLSRGEAIRTLGEKGYKDRLKAFIQVIVPQIAKELAELTLHNYEGAPQVSVLEMGQVFILVEESAEDEWKVPNRNDKQIDIFLEVYFIELEGRVEEWHKKIIKKVVGDLEMNYSTRNTGGFKTQMFRFEYE